MKDALKVRKVRIILKTNRLWSFFIRFQVFDQKKTSHYQEENSFSSEDPVEDDPVKIAHKGQ